MNRLVVRAAGVLFLCLGVAFVFMPWVLDTFLRADNRTVVQFLARPDVQVMLQDSHVVLPGFLREDGAPASLIIFFFSMLVTVAVVTSVVWVMPLVRRMNRYQTMAQRFSHGDLQARTGATGGDSIEDVGLALDDMAERIQGLLEEQEHLLQSVSHELRTPIARIRFLHEALDAARGDDDAFHRRLESLDDEITELDDLVSELLTFVRLDADATSLATTPVDLAHLAQDILNRQTRLQVTSKVRTKGETTVPAHARMARHAVKNVIGNAFRYAKSSVLIDVYEKAGCVVMQIDDDGPGIPTSARQRLLQPFERIDEGRARSTGGVGLGLAIVDRALSRHQGSVSIGASPLGGARVILTWPTPSTR